MSAQPSIELRKVCVVAGGHAILRDLDVTIAAGSRVALLGPSGSGKTTFIRVIAGLVAGLESGQVLLDGEVATAFPPHRRELAMVFQDLALWPHMNVRNHLTFVAPGVGADVVQTTIDAVGLVGRERSKPEELSGGERQRLALARALVVNPKRLLLDEPFSSLDLQLKREMISLTRSLHEDRGFTMIHVTHDPREAELMAERTILLDDGAVVWDGEAKALSKASSGQAGDLAKVLSWWRGE